MKTRSMEQTIGPRLYLMGFVSLVLAVAVCVFVFHRAFTMQAWRALQNESAIMAAQYSHDPQSLQAVSIDGVRITLISPDGTVLYESTDADEQTPMENHLSRPEVQQAFSTETGQDIRDSVTTGYETYYYAVLLEDGNVLRTAQEAKSIWSLYNDALPAILVSCLVILGLGALLAAVLTRRLVQPMLNMANDLDRIQETVPYSELIPFADAIYSDRTMRESNEKLRQEFTANVSHELKTPLTSVIGYLTLLSDEPDLTPEMRAKYTGIALDKAQRLETLINEFFEITRYNLQQIEIEKETIDLYYMLVQMADEFYPLLQKHGNRIELHVDENLTVHGDAMKLARVFNNILKNAIAYSYPDSVIEIWAQQNDTMIYIYFQNKGKTIPPHKLDSVFEKFFRLDEARTTNTGGAGLGLAIAKEIVDLHGGSITADSKNEITTFCVSLPLCD